LVAVGNLITDAGDSAGDLGNTLHVTDVNGQAVGSSLNLAATYGTLTVFSDGTYIYTANSALDAVLLGQNPTEQFNVTVSDSTGHSVATTLTFNVTGANETPQITAAVASGSMTEDAGPTVLANGGFETGDLSGWVSDGSVTAEATFIGGSFGTYSARMAGGHLSQDVVTTAGQHYTLSFDVAGDAEASSSGLNIVWDGATVFATSSLDGAFTHYSFDVMATGSTTLLDILGSSDGPGILLDQVAVEAANGPPTETTAGSVSFSDPETGDTHTASFTPQDVSYVGTFSLDPVSETGGSGSVDWHFTVNNSDIQFLSQGQQLIQTYTVFVTDEQGGSALQDVTVTINGANDAPTAVSENVITDVGAGGTVDIPIWALAANDTDPDQLDHVFVNALVSSSGGSAVGFGDAFFIDDATPGGSFTYTSSDGTATSNIATATVINNATNATTLTGTSGDDIIIATNGTETLSGGGGNDVLIGNSGSHVMTGGTGNDSFAFMQTSDGPGIITDFNNLTEHDHIAISASGFGGVLTPGMDVSSLFETSGDDQFSGSAVFHFDSGNQTLYYSADGTQASAITVTTLQSGVILNGHDLLIV
jgi:VCBS repeat-containing protein